MASSELNAADALPTNSSSIVSRFLGLTLSSSSTSTTTLAFRRLAPLASPLQAAVEEMSNSLVLVMLLTHGLVSRSTKAKRSVTSHTTSSSGRRFMETSDGQALLSFALLHSFESPICSSYSASPALRSSPP